MELLRPYALMQTEDQWLRGSHRGTALEAGILQLAFVDDTVLTVPGPDPGPAAGLAFDPQCRLYHSLPDAGQVERWLWAADGTLKPIDLFAPGPPLVTGDFHATPAGPLNQPRGLAVDARGRLFVAETGADRILVFDLFNRRLIRRIAVSGSPTDLAAHDNIIYAVTPQLLQLQAFKGPTVVPGLHGTRVAVADDGDVYVLDGDHIRSATHDLTVPFATDIELLPGPVLVVARRPKEDFLRFRISAGSTEELPPLKARGYDGLGIVRTPDGRIGFFTAAGFRNAVPARVKYVASGTTVTYRLDSGTYRTQWGRLILDACIPRETDVQVAFAASDDPPDDEDTLPRRLPDNVTEAVILRPDLSPPMPPESMVPAEIKGELYQPSADTCNFQDYEAPIEAPAGRYLWVFLQLTGNTRFTPRIRTLRAEYPSHDLLRRLPKVYSREPVSTAFLRRYLATFDGFLGQLEVGSNTREGLVEPLATPSEWLDWLAAFVGLVLDGRWPLATQRAILAEAVWLFRFRGTVPGLTRFLELYTGAQVIVIEKFRLRGPDLSAPSFEAKAHRFTVLIAASLSAEQLDVVRHILDVHRPAHALVDVCTVDAGMSIGLGLHVGLTSAIGRSSGFRTLQAGGSLLGRGTIVGRP
jgi:phage tail-like protein